MPGKISLYVKYIGSMSRIVSRISEWILFYTLLTFTLLSVFLSIYVFLALLSMALFMLPVSWVKYEFKLRFALFLSTVAFLALLFAVSGVSPVYIGIEVALAGFSAPLLVKRLRWFISEYMGTKEALYFVAFSTVVAVFAFFSRQIPEHLIIISGSITTILMLNYLCTALRRSELSRVLLEIGGFKTPEEFIEKLVEKADVKDDERRGFIRYWFREFLGYVERGEFKPAYVTFATCILEQIIIEQPNTGKSSIWDEIKDIELWRIHHDESSGKDKGVSHSDIRAAIVHSTPKKKEERYKEREMEKDLKRKKAILGRFIRDPITPIDHLLRGTVNKLGKSITKAESEN